MSEGIPKSRVSLTYDTKQPEGREKPRELPFRLLVLGDVGGAKDLPFDQRALRQLNGRNFGAVMKGLKIKLKDIPLDEKRKVDFVLDSVKSFSPDEVLRVLTGQKAAGEVDPDLQQAWGTAKASELWPGDPTLTALWAKREQVVGFQKSFQNSKTLRNALKRLSAPPADDADRAARKEMLEKMKAEIATKLKTPATPGATS
ncbi:MAG: type secretion system contractile sheath small subunit [Pseudomonadota bacterium]|jgi:predicted component of type VI protein secretion system